MYPMYFVVNYVSPTNQNRLKFVLGPLSLVMYSGKCTIGVRTPMLGSFIAWCPHSLPHNALP